MLSNFSNAICLLARKRWTAGTFRTILNGASKEVSHEKTPGRYLDPGRRVRALDTESEHLLISRDGVLLQNIQIVRHNIKDPLKHTKKKLAKDMLPQEAAEVLLDNVASNPGSTDFRVLENSPVPIGGLPGFKATYTYRNRDGLKCKSVCCGVLAGETFFAITYNATERYYFDKDIETFWKIVQSFAFVKAV
ncbi:MAG: hypothetical protein H6Q48_3230 [Deltaproteobacteria bacterium]|nr:hypothetical protein [Deltaproteobacteria bacterium]